jgi:hypothetical protein
LTVSAVARQASAMSVAPSRRYRLIAVLRTEAMIWAPLPMT